jgi:hypothetical protein
MLYAPDYHLTGTLAVTWNQRLGTGSNQAEFIIEQGSAVAIPGAGGSLALLAVSAIRRRRRT